MQDDDEVKFRAIGGTVTNDTWLWDVAAQVWLRPRAIPAVRPHLPSPWQSLAEFGSCVMGFVYLGFGFGIVLAVILLIVKVLKWMWYF